MLLFALFSNFLCIHFGNLIQLYVGNDSRTIEFNLILRLCINIVDSMVQIP